MPQSGGSLILIGPVLDIGEWYHAVVVYNNENGKLYVNGNLIDDKNGTYIYSTRFLALASGAGGTGLFNGFIDEVRIYNRVLSASEIQAVYNAGK